MIYRQDLPSLRLTLEEFKELEDVLEKHSTSAELQISVKSGGFTRKYESVDDLITDSPAPAIIDDFSITVEGEEGSCKLRTNSSGMITSLNDVYIKGDDDWVKIKKTDLEEYFNKNKNKIRTILEKQRFLFPISLLLGFAISVPVYFIWGGQVAYYVGLGCYITSWLFGLLGLNYIYPYAFIQLEESYVHRRLMKKIIVRLISLITTVAAGLTVVNYLL